MISQGMPRGEAEALTDLFARILDGRNAYVTDDVKRVTGHEPRDFADFVRVAAATGVWGLTTPVPAPILDLLPGNPGKSRT
jgi:hypothetical protein